MESVKNKEVQRILQRVEMQLISDIKYVRVRVRTLYTCTYMHVRVLQKCVKDLIKEIVSLFYLRARHETISLHVATTYRDHAQYNTLKSHLQRRRSFISFPAKLFAIISLIARTREYYRQYGFCF